MKWLQKLRDKKRLLLQAQNEALEQSKIVAEERLDAARLKMVSQYCAVRGEDLCTIGCVHFSAGFVYFWPSWEVGGASRYTFHCPSCRLWGK